MMLFGSAAPQRKQGWMLTRGGGNKGSDSGGMKPDRHSFSAGGGRKLQKTCNAEPRQQPPVHPAAAFTCRDAQKPLRKTQDGGKDGKAGREPGGGVATRERCGHQGENQGGVWPPGREPGRGVVTREKQKAPPTSSVSWLCCCFLIRFFSAERGKTINAFKSSNYLKDTQKQPRRNGGCSPRRSRYGAFIRRASFIGCLGR